MPQLDPLTAQQLMGICNLQQSSNQAEEPLSQGLEQLHQSLADTISSGSLNNGANVDDYMGQMAISLGKLSNLEGFVHQRIAETLDLEIKRWSAGKQGNLRALLSTLQYIKESSDGKVTRTS